MTNPGAGSDLTTTWKEVVDEITGEISVPGLEPPALTRLQHACLNMLEPAIIIDGYAVLSAPDAHSKQLTEEELAEYISEALTRKMGTHCVVAITVAQGSPVAPEKPKVEKTQEKNVEKPTKTRWNSFGATNSKNDRTVPDSAINGKQIPMNLDELAQEYTKQQSNYRPQPTVTRQRLPREKPSVDPNRETSLNPRYTFETFVVGSSNRFANGAAVAVAEAPAKAYNPLFIWGGSGLGKTHLLHAAGNYAQQLQPGLRVKYVSSEEFTNDYINSVRDDRQESFKRRYRDLDVLMVDDIQFLEGKEGTQEEFFHTFNALHQADKQIILSSDRPPKELSTLEDRLRTRFEGGLITDVQPPDLETRIAILEKKAATDGNDVERPVLEMIASQFESSIRELEGALIRATAYASLVNEPITMDNATVALRDIIPDGNDVVITASIIKAVTAEYFNLDVALLTGTGRTRPVVHARQLAMYLCRELTELSLPKIGDEFGGKDHTTVIHAEKKIRQEMTENRDTYDEIQQLTQIIKARGKVQ